MSEPDPRAIVDAFFEAISNADVAKLDELYADDFELWTAGTLPLSGTKTRAEALEGMGMVGAMFPDGLRFEVIATTCEGERVAIEAESDGVHANGRRYHNQYHFLMEIRGGRIRRFKEYLDTQHADEVMFQ
ncbi:MAG: nuclear transport factor 2 family protein [Myxococcales bacterium]|nr:nuclear transport factor 2 family protein [Myxococcales bacterium]